MDCIKESKRDLYNLFTVYTCDNCSSFISDEYILIGKQIIREIPLIKRCDKVDKYKEIIVKNKRRNDILKEMDKYLNMFDDYIFLWVDDINELFVYHLSELEIFIDSGFNICIIY